MLKSARHLLSAFLILLMLLWGVSADAAMVTQRGALSDYAFGFSGKLDRIFTISPAYAGNSKWDLDKQGALNMTTAGTYTLTPNWGFAVALSVAGSGGTGGGGGWRNNKTSYGCGGSGSTGGASSFDGLTGNGGGGGGGGCGAATYCSGTTTGGTGSPGTATGGDTNITGGGGAGGAGGAGDGCDNGGSGGAGGLATATRRQLTASSPYSAVVGSFDGYITITGTH